ncbi:DNA-directed RNA polymerase subunit A' [Candidatus Woesearchaeota archaeon]|nr:DNA-directed RNA polymerase subunit A' [Candidatus Woesearchaeota archaeon]
MEAITKKIDKINFGLISPNKIKKIATVNIVSPELYDADGYPVERGLMDLGMGVIDPGLRCKTCGARLRTCPGHFGYIQLARPIVHILYIKKVYDLLRSFCGACGRILLMQDKIEKWTEKIRKLRREGNFDEIRNLTKSLISNIRKKRKCPHCNAKALKIRLDKPTTFRAGGKRLWPTEVRERLEKIPDTDLEILGYDTASIRPEWMVLTLLLVPPITMRPSITLVTGERSEDDLTHKLSDVVRVNQRLVENINAGAPEIIIEDLWDLLQYHVTTLMNNSISQVPPARHKTNRPLKTLAQRLKGKEGRFRYNLAGKRVNFCARSVISPDPLISIDEVGVPYRIARELTIPEKVTEWNVKWLKECIKNGDIWPGATYVITEDNKRKKITEETKEQILDELAPGWIVERHLLNDDIILFNRQPSLHRLSLMGHRVRLLPSKTFRINPAVVTPYNADFDGDEMNLHLPQTEEARSEAKNIMRLDKQIITPRYGLSIIGEIEDPVVGLYILTRGNTYLTKEDAYNLLLSAGTDAELPKAERTREGVDYWNGRQIFSMLFPDDFNFKNEEIKIENGELVDGTIMEELIGPEGGVIIHHIYKKYGSEKTKEFINAMNRVGLEFIKHFPYTFSFSDLDLSEKTQNKIKEIIKNGRKEVGKILKKYRKGKITPLPGKTIEETVEALILNALNKLRTPVGKLINKEKAQEDNNLMLMIKGGFAKLLNLALMSGFAGQQTIQGERIHKGYTGRTTSHFKKASLGARAHGFIAHGFVEGMDPVETFFNAVAGRNNLMDTAMRTPKSGYMQRRLINALQDLKVSYDGTVRDAGQRIVQFSFGGDNIDVSKSDHGDIEVKKQ